MTKQRPSYEELANRLAQAEGIIEALQREQVDAVVGQQEVMLVRLEKVERALMESEEKCRQLFVNENDAILLSDAESRQIVDINPAAERLYGYSRQEFLQLSIDDLTAPPPDKLTENKTEVADSIFWQRRNNGSIFPVEDACTTFDWDGRHLESRILRDMSERLVYDTRLRTSRENFRNVVEKNRTGILVVDKNGIVIFGNPAACSLLNKDPQELSGMKFGIPALGSYTEMEIWRDETHKRTAELSATETVWETQPVYLVMLYDITERRDAEAMIRHMAYHDDLTGLPNRILLLERLEQALRTAQRSGNRLALLYLDLDGFKSINDTFGHSIGDQVLQEVAKRLPDYLRDMDAVARLGGDEFAVILEQVGSREAVITVADKLLEAFEHPIEVDGKNLYTKPSIGISLFPEHGRTPSELLKNADTAMYQVKSDPGHTFCLYDSEMSLKVAGRLKLDIELRNALEQQEFALFYQPQINITGEHLVGMEALLRWQHPERGIITPDSFIPALEETGLILPVGAWVIQDACRQLREWRQQGLPPIPVSVNVSARQLMAEGFLDTLRIPLETNGLPPGSLILEVTESILMWDLEHALRVLTQVTQLGVELHLDDFGTGYSSLSMLRRLPFDAVKVDRSFIRDIPHDGDDCALTRAIVVMAHTLGKEVVAEGVENDKQLSYLKRIDCDASQGYLFSKPLPVAEMEILLQKDTSTGSGQA
ncbi:MAG: EAL domain-containing protein [Sedimenticola sp.]